MRHFFPLFFWSPLGGTCSSCSGIARTPIHFLQAFKISDTTISYCLLGDTCRSCQSVISPPRAGFLGNLKVGWVTMRHNIRSLASDTLTATTTRFSSFVWMTPTETASTVCTSLWCYACGPSYFTVGAIEAPTTTLCRASRSQVVLTQLYSQLRLFPIASAASRFCCRSLQSAQS